MTLMTYWRLPAASRTRQPALVLLCLAVVVQATGQPNDESAIRSARADSNRAIVAHDVPGIVRHWLPDVHIVTSTSAQATGRDANGERMTQQFMRRPDTVYVRTPQTVDVLSAGPSHRNAARGPAGGPSPTALSKSPAPIWPNGARSTAYGGSKPNSSSRPRAADRVTA